jgi:3-isopropylmalate/(R)-2-methylmalate dehydratase small subunit
MEPFVRITAVAAPLLQANVDTDQIVPTRFLLLPPDEMARGLFAEWRLRPDGSLAPGFILNREPWSAAAILLAGANFGCGSSREAAPRVLRANGIRAVIAPSFADIFFNNSFRSGLLPVRLGADVVDAIGRRIERASTTPEATLTVDLADEVVIDGGMRHAFETPPLLREMLLTGADDIALTLQRSAAIDAFRAADRVRTPWAWP